MPGDGLPVPKNYIYIYMDGWIDRYVGRKDTICEISRRDVLILKYLEEGRKLNIWVVSWKYVVHDSILLL